MFLIIVSRFSTCNKLYSKQCLFINLINHVYCRSQFRYDYYSVSVNANHVYSLTTEATECYILSKLKEHLTQKMCFGRQK